MALVRYVDPLPDVGVAVQGVRRVGAGAGVLFKKKRQLRGKAKLDLAAESTPARHSTADCRVTVDASLRVIKASSCRCMQLCA